MANYVVNKNSQPNGDHEVHRVDTCTRLPDLQNRISLGDFTSCRDAVQEAKRRFPQEASKINGCYYCSKECHTT